jgi:hypothetical protein
MMNTQRISIAILNRLGCIRAATIDSECQKEFVDLNKPVMRTSSTNLTCLVITKVTIEKVHKLRSCQKKHISTWTFVIEFDISRRNVIRILHNHSKAIHVCR